MRAAGREVNSGVIREGLPEEVSLRVESVMERTLGRQFAEYPLRMGKEEPRPMGKEAGVSSRRHMLVRAGQWHCVLEKYSTWLQNVPKKKKFPGGLVVKDLMLSLLWHRFDSWPQNVCMLWAQLKKRKE